MSLDEGDVEDAVNVILHRQFQIKDNAKVDHS